MGQLDTQQLRLSLRCKRPLRQALRDSSQACGIIGREVREKIRVLSTWQKQEGGEVGFNIGKPQRLDHLPSYVTPT